MPTYNQILSRYVYPTENSSEEKVFPYGDSLTMFPALIKHYDIDISTEAKYNDTTKEFKITSVDWVNKIITTDKKVILPNIQNEVNAQYWQMYVLGYEVNTANNVLQLVSQVNSNTFTFEIKSTQTQVGLALIFTVNSIIGFRNPQQTWIPLSLQYLVDSGISYTNHSSAYICRHNNQFLSLILYNDGIINNVGFGISTSDDFITWTPINNIVAISTNPLPEWLWPDLKQIVPNTSINNIIGNTHKLLFTTINVDGLFDVSIMETEDFIHYNFAPTYFTYTGKIDGEDISFWTGSSYYVYNNKYYISMSVALTSNTKTAIFEWGGSYNNMELTLVQTLGLSRPSNCWNAGYTEYLSPFIVNNKLYAFCIGGTIDTNSSEIGNQGKTNGLYIFNDSTGLFEEYMSNPVIMNVELNNDYLIYSDHQDKVIVYPYNNKLYSLMTFNGGTNTYKVIPAQICMKNKTMVDDWKTQTINLNV